MKIPAKADEETYLGDGLYVSFDGYQLMLRAPRENGDHVTYLEYSVYRSLVNFVGRRGINWNTTEPAKAEEQ